MYAKVVLDLMSGLENSGNSIVVNSIGVCSKVGSVGIV